MLLRGRGRGRRRPVCVFAVEREVVLAFFSFGKFLMYRDLEEGLWPEGSKPSRHPIVGALLGGGFVAGPASRFDEDPSRSTRSS